MELIRKKCQDVKNISNCFFFFLFNKLITPMHQRCVLLNYFIYFIAFFCLLNVQSFIQMVTLNESNQLQRAGKKSGGAGDLRFTTCSYVASDSSTLALAELRLFIHWVKQTKSCQGYVIPQLIFPLRSTLQFLPSIFFFFCRDLKMPIAPISL